MKPVLLFSLLVYTLGMFIYAGLGLLWLRRRPVWGRGLAGPQAGPSEGLAGTLTLVSFVWFACNTAMILGSLVPALDSQLLRVVTMILTFLWPPLIMHATLVDHRGDSSRSDHPAWRVALVTMYLAGTAFAVTSTLYVFGWSRLPVASASWFAWTVGGPFVIAGIYSALRVRSRPRQLETRDQRLGRRATLGLLAVMIAIFLLLGFSLNLGSFEFAGVIELLARSLPLLFLVLSVYYENRYEFFDLFVKRGLAVLSSLIALTVFFAAVLPLLGSLVNEWAAPWIFAIVSLPLIVFLRWFHRRLSTWLDNRWLGRLLSPEEAVKQFLADNHGQCTEQPLVERAERSLATISGAPAKIVLDLREAPACEFPVEQRIPIRSGEHRLGEIQLGARTRGLPYFAEDRALLGSLGEVLGYMLENVRLQQRRREQDQVTRELSLQASRSELRALRAQINPHFLFNALNAIAGLIHKDPLRADRTVERLAEIFRYTLHGSQREWARLNDELEFARAYLDVEQSRFGERLRYEVSCDDDVGSRKVPALLVQTLVENAVKHGVANLRGPGFVGVRARLDDGALVVEVVDDGPGFEATSRTAPSLGERRAGSGYGLRNVRERLAAHHGDAAELRIERDDARERTCVSIRFPRSEGEDRDEADSPPGAGSSGAVSA